MTSLEVAQARRDDGIARAGEHAGKRWQRQALGYLLEFLTTPRSAEPFLVEVVREFAEGRGCDAPPDGRAWGIVAREAGREKPDRPAIILKDGYAPAKSSNLSAKVLWRRP